MKSILKITLLFSSILVFIISCNEKELGKESVLSPSSETKTELDKWTEKNFVDTYNVKLIYKYNDARIPQENWVIPVSYEKAVQMANIIKYLFFDAYKKHTPKNFLERYCPKEIMLIGSGAYNNNGTVKLGLAENGVRFSLLNINKLDPNDIEKLYEYYFRTIYHEFSHILHQTKEYSPEFKKISAKDYVQDSWNNVWREPNNNDPDNLKKRKSLEAGFISDYSSKDSNEDFVELIAHYLTYSPQKWQETLNLASGKADGSGDKEGKKILEQKIAIVIAYMQETWNINLDDLRDEIQERAANINNLDLNSLN